MLSSIYESCNSVDVGVNEVEVLGSTITLVGKRPVERQQNDVGDERLFSCHAEILVPEVDACLY